MTNPKPSRDVLFAAEMNFEFAMDKRNSFPRRVKAFIRGENKLGRTVGSVLDIATIFLPRVGQARQAVQVIVNRKQKSQDNMDKLKDWISQPSTKAGLVVLTAVAAIFGLDLNPELLEEAAIQIVTGVALVVAGATAIYEMFRGEKT